VEATQQHGKTAGVKILCVSDRVETMLQGPSLNAYAGDVEAVISCGDLPFSYLEYLVTFLGVPVYYVLGNHDPAPDGPEYPGGCTPLDGRVVEMEDGKGEANGVVLAGLSGSRLYSGGPNQYTERQMRRRTRALSTRIRCRGLFGGPKPRIFVTHSPPFKLGDAKDHAHVGFESFVGMMDRHRPELWLHGHVTTASVPDLRVDVGRTTLVNVTGSVLIELEPPAGTA